MCLLDLLLEDCVRVMCRVTRSYWRCYPHIHQEGDNYCLLCRNRAMGAIKLDHSDQAQHRASIMQQLRQLWMDDHLCDVVLKSDDGTEHRAHKAVLSAASMFFRNLLGGTFLEAERVRQKQPVENCCVQSGSVCIAGLHLRRAA